MSILGDVMTVAHMLAPLEPFMDDLAGCAYFATDFHYRRLAVKIRKQLTKKRGFLLLTGDSVPDGDLLTYSLNAEADGYRATSVDAHAAMDFNELIGGYSSQLGLAADSEGSTLWPFLSHLMREARNGAARVLVVGNAEKLDDHVFDELYRFAKLDDPHHIPVVLVATPSFVERLESAPLRFLRSAIVAHHVLQHLDDDEVAAFIHYQLNTVGGDVHEPFTPELIDAIAAAAKGKPAVVNRLARGVASGLDPASLLIGDRMPDNDARSETSPEECAGTMEVMVSGADGSREMIAESETIPQSLPDFLQVPPPPARPRHSVTSALAVGIYVVAALISGATMLYFLLSGLHPAPRSYVQAEVPPRPAMTVATADAAAVEGAPSLPGPTTDRDLARPSSEEVALLVRRGEELLGGGDIVSARRFFERAADTDDVDAAFDLGKSYDPLFLQQIGARGIAGNPFRAASWYRRAVAAGNAEAGDRLQNLIDKYPLQ